MSQLFEITLGIMTAMGGSSWRKKRPRPPRRISRWSSVVDLSATWSDRHVSVCFLDGGIDARLHVIEVARRWMEATGLQFDFGPDGSPRTCQAGRVRATSG